MTKFLLIVLLIAVIAVLAWLAARSRRHTENALPADDRPNAIEPGASDEILMVPPPSDISASSVMSSPLPPPEPQPVEQPTPAPEPEVVAQTEPPVEPEPVADPLPEPDPIVEPEPPVEPEPAIEPEPDPVEPEPAIEPEPEPVEPEPLVEPDHEPDEPEPEPLTTTHGDPLADEAKTELPAEELDAHAGWESDEDRTIHADPESGLYHTPDSPGYKLGEDGQVFESEDAARAAGFTRWDQPR